MSGTGKVAGRFQPAEFAPLDLRDDLYVVLEPEQARERIDIEKAMPR
jgi:hypothetical protein